MLLTVTRYILHYDNMSHYMYIAGLAKFCKSDNCSCLTEISGFPACRAGGFASPDGVRCYTML